jgi:hypothetical protein
MRKPLSPNALGHAFPTTTAGGSVILFDDGQAGNGSPAPAPSYSHVVMACLLDEDVTLLIQWAPDRNAADAALVTINGSGSGETIAGDAFYSKRIPLWPGRNKISVLMGTTAPTSSLIAAEVNTFDGALA